MKALIVDDEDLIRKSLKRAFEIRKHEVIVAENGIQGLELWQKHKPDMVVLDVLMPGLTGPQVLKNIGSQPKSKVILISAYTGEYDVKRAEELGAAFFMAKPFQNVFDVVDRAEKLIRNES